MSTEIALIGLGNILLRDEGVGVHAVEALRKRFDFPEGIHLFDGGTLGLDLLPLMDGVDKIIFIDALDLKQEPGTIALLEDDEIPSFFATKLSCHQVGLADLLFAAKLIGLTPSKTVLVGIQPEEIATGLALSQRVRENFGRLLTTVLEKLHEWQVPFHEKKERETRPCA